MGYGQATTGMRQSPWTLSEEDGRTFIRRALDLRVNFFDTANNYSDGESGARPGAARLCAPVRPGPNGRSLSRKAILSEIDKSLQRLSTDYIDLYPIHLFDHDTRPDEILSTLHELAPSRTR